MNIKTDTITSCKYNCDTHTVTVDFKNDVFIDIALHNEDYSCCDFFKSKKDWEEYVKFINGVDSELSALLRGDSH